MGGTLDGAFTDDGVDGRTVATLCEQDSKVRAHSDLPKPVAELPEILEDLGLLANLWTDLPVALVVRQQHASRRDQLP